MDIHSMLADLRGERARLDEAILTLERLAMHGKKRRGRPPKWMAEQRPAESQPRKKRAFSAATRKRMADAQTRRWAAKRQSA